MKPCKKGCGVEIGFRMEGADWIPTNSDGTDHRDTCTKKTPKVCKKCGGDVVWRQDEPKDPKTGERHACLGLVPSHLKITSRHHVSQWRLKRYAECQLASYFGDVLELPQGQKTPEMESGSLVHACREFVAVERDKAGNLGEPVHSAEYLAALDFVAAREPWSVEAFTLAHKSLSGAKPVDLSLVHRDEKGILCERAAEVQCGGDVVAGLVVDLVEKADDYYFIRDLKAGQWRDPRPQDSAQVALYLAWGGERFGPNVAFVMDYITLGVEEDPIPWTPELAERGKALARGLVTKTRAKRNDPEAWPGTFGTHCLRCPFQSKCDTFKSSMGDAAEIADSIGDRSFSPATGADLAASIYRWGPTATVLSKAVDSWRDALKEHAATVVETESFTDDDGKPKTVGKAVIGGYPIRLTTYVQSPEKKIREGGIRQRLDVYDPIETSGISAASSHCLVGGNGAGQTPTTALIPTIPSVASIDNAAGIGRPDDLTTTPMPAAQPTPEFIASLEPSPDVIGVAPKKRGRPRKAPAMVVLSETPGPSVTSSFLNGETECKHFVIGPCKLCGAAT